MRKMLLFIRIVYRELSVERIIYLKCRTPEMIKYQWKFSGNFNSYIGCFRIWVYCIHCFARGGVVGWDTALQAGRLRIRFPMVSLKFFLNWILPATLWKYIWSFFDRAHSIELFHQPTLMHNFLYSLTICLLYYYPRHVSSINMPISISVLCRRLQRAKISDAVWI